MTNNYDKASAKILVLGDSGVGKSSLIHLLCHSQVLSSAQWTIGCSIDVKLHDNCFLEFWDIGGSRGHKIARSFLYQDYHGIMLVFDVTNNKSRLNLNEWLMEVTQKTNDKDLEAFVNVDVPIITIATKKDLLPHRGVGYQESGYVKYPGPYGRLDVNTQDVLSFNYGSKNYEKLESFFKSVIDRRVKKFYNKFAI